MKRHNDSIGKALVTWSNYTDRSLIVMKGSQQDYRTLHNAITRGELPMRVRKFGGLLALGNVDTMTATAAATVDTLQARSHALQALLEVVAAWEPRFGLYDGLGAPESYSRRPHIAHLPWRVDQPYTAPVISCYPHSNIATRSTINATTRERTGYRPTDAEIDSMQIPGAGKDSLAIIYETPESY
jgi:hypothetical protein